MLRLPLTRRPMPPKKKEVDEGPQILGRISGNLQMGIVGMPNVGKSSLFNLLTRMAVPAENYPFCTIDPSVSRVYVPDSRFDWLCDLYGPPSKVAAHMQITDIAGLVRGAAQGEGLGNAFLSHIRAVDGIYQMVRLFDDPDITHVEETVDPIRDMEIINSELIAKDLEFAEKELGKLEAIVDRVDKKRKPELDLMMRVVATLKEGKHLRLEKWKASEVAFLNPYQFLTAKPVVYLLNLSKNDFLRKKNKWLGKVKQWVDANGAATIVPISVALETELYTSTDEAEKATSGLPRAILAGYSALHLIHFFTVGPDEVKCWTVRTGAKAPQAGAVIHTDFEKAFICAEVMKYEDLKEAGTENAVKSAGKYRQQGKEYVVCDGDIILFKVGQVNAPKAKAK